MKLQWLTNSIGVLEISGFGPGWIVRMQMKTFMHRTLDGLLFLHDVSLVQQQTLELVGNCMAYSLLLPILIRLHFKAICTSTTSPHIARA